MERIGIKILQKTNVLQMVKSKKEVNRINTEMVPVMERCDLFLLIERERKKNATTRKRRHVHREPFSHHRPIRTAYQQRVLSQRMI